MSSNATIYELSDDEPQHRFKSGLANDSISTISLCLDLGLAPTIFTRSNFRSSTIQSNDRTENDIMESVRPIGFRTMTDETLQIKLCEEPRHDIWRLIFLDLCRLLSLAYFFHICFQGRVIVM